MHYKLVVIKVDSRTAHAAEVQKLLTEHGCMIKVRLEDCMTCRRTAVAPPG